MYKMDVRQMLDAHRQKGAAATVAVIPVRVEEARAFGVLEVDASGKVLRFDEKPAVPREMPGRPGWALASMGNYVFDTTVLVEALGHDAAGGAGGESAHDFGRNILPEMVARGLNVFAYDFATNEVPGAHENEHGYWRDVGTILAYWQANMDLIQVVPTFDLYNPRWPIRTWTRPAPPAKFVFADPGTPEKEARMGIATDSLVSEGCIVSGGRVDRTVLSPWVRVNSYAHVEESILLDGVEIGRHCKLRRCIVDKGVHIPQGTEIGFDPEADARRFTVTDGIVVIPKGYHFA
jgi:glucose-1-phosphate adenylyltransferase